MHSKHTHIYTRFKHIIVPIVPKYDPKGDNTSNKREGAKRGIKVQITLFCDRKWYRRNTVTKKEVTNSVQKEC